MEIPFVSVDDDEVFFESAGQVEANWVAVGRESVRSSFEHQREQIGQELVDDGTMIIVPTGETGGFAWRELPCELSSLVSSPVKSAVIVINTNAAELLESSNSWQALAAAQRSCRVSEITLHASRPVWTSLLAPQRSRIPGWLNDRIHAVRSTPVRSAPDELAVRAGLLQIHDQLEPSHQQSQRCQGDGCECGRGLLAWNHASTRTGFRQFEILVSPRRRSSLLQRSRPHRNKDPRGMPFCRRGEMVASIDRSKLGSVRFCRLVRALRDSRRQRIDRRRAVNSTARDVAVIETNLA